MRGETDVKEIYEKPELDIIVFDIADIVTSSGPNTSPIDEIDGD